MTRFSLLIGGMVVSAALGAGPAAAQAPYGPRGHKPPATPGTCALSRSCSPGASIDVLPYVTALGRTGRLRLEVLPAGAEVYVDGVYAGHAEQFDGVSPHAALAPGGHRIDVRAEGYEGFVFGTQIVRSKPTVERVALSPLRRP
jgi:hypothetical protein